jgi:hypothetical protein
MSMDMLPASRTPSSAGFPMLEMREGLTVRLA